MSEENIYRITPVSEDTKAGIKRNSAERLPDNPTASGMKPADIKAAFFKALTNGDNSLLSELERVIKEANVIINNLGASINNEIDARSGADSAIRQSAVGIPEYNAETGVLTFKTLDGNTEVTHDIPVEKIIDSVELSKDGTAFIFTFHNNSPIRVDVGRLTNPAWRDVVDDSPIPPTALAVKKGCVEKIEKPLGAYYYTYGIGTDGKTELKRANATSEPATLVVRDSSGYIFVKPPTANTHPVNKGYIDTKSNNSLYNEVMDLERRMVNTEYGFLKTKTVTGTGKAVQVERALPYGIFTKVGNGVRYIRVGLPFKFEGGTNIFDSSEGGFYIKAGKMAYIPCSVPTECEVSVHCDCGTVTGYYLASASPSVVGNKINIGESTSYPKEVITPVENIGLYRSNTANDDLVTFFRVMFSDPEQANIARVIYEYEIPEAIRTISGYSVVGSYLDFENKVFHKADGTEVDVSEHLGADADVFSLLPGAIIRFYDDGNTEIAASYSLTYKNKL